MNQNNSIKELAATEVFEWNWDAIHSNKRFIKNEGGSRSSKTYSICQVLILYCLQNQNKLVSIIRRTGPALMASVFRDFKEVMEDMKIWEEDDWSKSSRIYTFRTGSQIEFFSADQEQKLRGRKRHIAWVNEANEITYDSFQQLNLRTIEKIIVDYNPSEIDSYLYALPADKTVTLHSTYHNNPFLTPAIIEEIENYKNTDLDYYTIFALGKRAHSRENVYQQWHILDKKPEHLTEFLYAIDYGFTHPTAMVKIWYTRDSREVFIEELIYESYLTSSDIIRRMEDSNVDKKKMIVSETARPEIVADIRRAGYAIIGADKDVKDGINNVKTFIMNVDSRASNVIKENQNYRYKKHNGIMTEEVIKLWDDAMDAIRYGLMYIKKYELKQTNGTSQIFSFEI
jgi:phage terminase large subunit